MRRVTIRCIGSHAKAACVLLLAVALPALCAPFAQGLLWRIDKPGVPSSFVFGTLHSNDVRVVALPAPVEHAFAQAKSFAMEVYLSDFEESAFYDATQFDDGRRLESIVGAETYAGLRLALGAAAPPDDVLARTKPWAALLRVAAARPGSDAPTLDQKLLVAARQRHLELIGLEGIDEQVALFDGIPLDTQVAILRHVLDRREALQALAEPTIRAWLERDLGALARINQAAAGADAELARHYAVLTRYIVDYRSVLMSHRLFLPLRRGRVFVAVGAMHLYGDQGLLALLRQQGYRVRRVY